MKAWTVFSIVTSVLLLAACGPPKQKIPVSTDPIGATVYADGKKTCTSPCSVSLDKQGEHLITIVKEGYQQEEIIVRRQFKPDRAVRDGVISGLLKGGDPKDVAEETAKKVDEQERSGEAYELTPSIITQTLTPNQSGL
ncbi:PEGA domain-containing protein [Pseudodesulfovibrio sp. JC047]|uniref:PEGA domain-containing protein n=1 Tax=Pseudodesulfovibrio sp. JC047 TaxID=2683199 RepID=UPI0013D200DA|nr:PEGA domain-containing protein [Pseudodesulfovibrio sp. JC047]NDV20210.1 PEGA domain-containing protein [Pseudodesulfovibrio sp. JC047]